MFFKSEDNEICFFTQSEDSTLELNSINLDELRNLPKDENFTKMPYYLLLKFSGEVKD